MDLLKYVYKNTSSLPRIKIYNMINTASVLQGIRTGCIITSIGNENVDELIDILNDNNIYAKVYPISKRSGLSNVLLLKKGRSELSKLFYNLHNAQNNNFNTNVGKILGYINPGTLHNIASMKGIYIEITVMLPSGSIETINFFPQKVKAINNTTIDRFNNVEIQLHNLELPDGFNVVATRRVIV